MKKIFDWVPWFRELANKIGEGGPGYLAARAAEVNWRQPNPPLLRAKKIDPFSFFSYLATNNSKVGWKTVYRSVSDVFGKRISIDSLPDEGSFYFPMPRAVGALFFGKDGGNPDLLWELFRQALSDSVRDETFETAQEIKWVKIRKLSQTLFLIDPTRFLPFDDHSVLSLGVGNLKELPSKITWAQYRQEIGKIKAAFPGCELYEIQMFSYLWNKNRMSINPGSYQVSTNVNDDKRDHWGNFNINNWVYTGGPGNRTPWPDQDAPAPRGRYPLDDPVRGDVVLVRYGRRQGRGIGIVYKNDYKEKLSAYSKLHVLWLNKKSVRLAGKMPVIGFSRAGKTTKEAFRSTAEYSPTYELLERLRSDAPPRPTLNPVVHPCNQILYGPPGTGKTWNAVNHAMAIVRGVNLDRIGEEDRAQFHASRFEPKAGTRQIAMVTFHQSFAYEDFVEGIRPKLDDDRIGYKLRDGVFKRIVNAAREDPERRYVLIIDEINRGNIPKIFGELITLIEDSKRLGETDGMSVTLPYSNEEFGVPSNLYIIGTMNTADRSILLLDTALRRRFDFVEMMPDPEHHLISNNVEGVDAQKMLTAMNERISLLLDREHQIGHTYLFDVTDLKSLSDKFQNKIFPLLQEYFYDDWSKICEVLGGAGFVSEQKLSYTGQLRNSDFVDEDRLVYKRLPKEDPKWLDPDEYKKIYSGDSSSGSS